MLRVLTIRAAAILPICRGGYREAPHLVALYTAMPYNYIMIFIETSTFTKLIGTYLSDDEYLGLQHFLLKYPDAGVIIRGTGGVRKLRWGISDKGKRGGIRVIYYWKRRDDEIWLLTVYGKSERDTIPSHILRQIAEEIRDV